MFAFEAGPFFQFASLPGSQTAERDLEGMQGTLWSTEAISPASWRTWNKPLADKNFLKPEGQLSNSAWKRSNLWKLNWAERPGPSILWQEKLYNLLKPELRQVMVPLMAILQTRPGVFQGLDAHCNSATGLGVVFMVFVLCMACHGYVFKLQYQPQNSRSNAIGLFGLL